MKIGQNTVLTSHITNKLISNVKTCIHSYYVNIVALVPKFVCNLAYLVQIIKLKFLEWILVNIWWDVTTEYSCVEFVQIFSFRINFSGWLSGVSAHSEVGRQSLIPELVRDGKMLKTHFYSPLPLPLSETSIPRWSWCYTTLAHTSTPSQLAKNAKCFTEFTKSEFSA